MPAFATPVVRLEADGLETLYLDNSAGIDVVTLDPGDPEIRAVMSDAPDSDGTVDTTAFLGARVITAELHCDRATWATRQLLRSYTSPKRRPTLFLQMGADAPEQQVTVRGSRFSDNHGAAWFGGGQMTITVQWVAPLGILESVELHEATARAGESPTTDGLAFPISFPLAWPSADPAGSTAVINAGTADAYPTIRIYGPCEGPAIENITQSRALVFTELEVLAGEYVEIDTRAKTIRYLSDPTDSRYDNLDFPTSRWWTLSPGLNVIRFFPDVYTAPSLAVITHRDAWL